LPRRSSGKPTRRRKPYASGSGLLAHTLAKLTLTEELAHALRNALERSLAPERLIAFDRLLGLLSGFRETLILNAGNADTGRRAGASDQPPVD